MRLASKTNSEWVGDAVETADHSQGIVYACQEKRCDPLPSHCHKLRPYLVWSTNVQSGN